MSFEYLLGEADNMKYDILVVDDNDLVQSTFKVVLNLNSLSFISADNGRIALELLKENQVRFVITDMDMPEVNGIELAKQVRVLYPDITIVAFTGSSGTGLPEDAQKYFHWIYHKTESMMNLIKQIKSSIDDQAACPAT